MIGVRILSESKPNMMDLHGIIEKEFFGTKSLAALIWLIDMGRELEFEFNGTIYFISRYADAKKYVSLWQDKSEQSFDSVSELIVNATIENHPFLFVWNEAKIQTLF